MKLLREGPLGAVKTDTDGGFTLVNKQELKEAVTSSLREPQYQEIVVHEDLATDMVQEYRNVCEMVRLRSGDSELANALTSSLRRGGRDFACSVLTTVKTHKDPGQVSLRIIHAAPKHFMNPGMRWIGMHLKSFIAKHPHILKDTDQLLSQLKRLKVPSTARLSKFDIKDFFMSGRHHLLSDLASQCFPEDIRTDARCMIDCILSNQVVQVPGEQRLLSVKVDTGMGLRCSGELSDACFYKLAEEGFASDLEVQQRYGVLHYSRFKDDGFIIIDGTREQRNSFCQQLKRIAGCFQSL